MPPLDKLTWLKKKLGFDVEAARKKKAAGAAGAAPAVQAAAVAAAAGGAATAPGWQGAQRTPATAASGVQIGANRQPPPAAGSVKIGANRTPRPTAAPNPAALNPAAPDPAALYSATLNPAADDPLRTDALSYIGPQSEQPPSPEAPPPSIDIGSYVTQEELAERLKPKQPAPVDIGSYVTQEELAERQKANQTAPQEAGNYQTQEQMYALSKQFDDSDDEDEDEDDVEDGGGSGNLGDPAPKRKFKIDKESIEKKVKTFEPVDASNTDYATGVQGATGMKGKFVGDEYAGEHNQAGWREKPWGVEGGNTGITTALSTEGERKDNTLVLQEDGSYTKGDGDVSDETHGYAMDPKTGEMVTFADRMNIVTKGPGGEKILSGTTGTVQGVNAFKRGDGDLEVTHHTTALGGDVVLDENGEAKLDSRGRPVMKSREAAAAGYVKFNFQGQMVSISNASGHYKPSVSMLLQAVEHLSKQGAFFEDEVTDADGNEVDSDSKPGKLFAAVQQKLKQQAPLLQLAQTKTAELAEATDEKEQERLAKEIEDLSKQVDSLSKELEAPAKILAKLGIAPSMRMRRNARVEVTEAKAGMTGAEVRMASTTTTKVENFLKSGGNEEQLKLKKTMMEELEEKTAGKRETLDQMADVRSRRTPGGEPAPSKRDIKNALNELQSGSAPDQQDQNGEQNGGSGNGQQSKPGGRNPTLQSLDGGAYKEEDGSEESDPEKYLEQTGTEDSDPSKYLEQTDTK